MLHARKRGTESRAQRHRNTGGSAHAVSLLTIVIPIEVNSVERVAGFGEHDHSPSQYKLLPATGLSTIISGDHGIVGG